MNQLINVTPRLKLSAVFLYFIRSFSKNRTQLNKLLFFTDIVFLKEEGETLTGCDYYKLQYGPVPEEIEWVKRSLVKEGMASSKIIRNSLYNEFLYRSEIKENKIENMFKNLFPDNYKEKMKILSRIYKGVGSISAGTLSNISHDYEPWKSASVSVKLDLLQGVKDKGLIDWLEHRGCL